jgi:outer membrane usher protein
MRGITNILTAYAGTQYSKNYLAVLIGAAVGTPVGAISADVTQSKSRLGGDEGDLAGQSYRVSYSKLINETNSNITIAAYRYSSSGYMDLQTATQTRDAIKHGDDRIPSGVRKPVFGEPQPGLTRQSGECVCQRVDAGLLEQRHQLQHAVPDWLFQQLQVAELQHQRQPQQSGKRPDQTTWYPTLSMPLWPGHAGSTPYVSMRLTRTATAVAASRRTSPAPSGR